MQGELAQPGPIDPSVLHLQASHRSQRIWEGQPVFPLRIYHIENTWRASLPLSFYHMRLLRHIESAGFYGFFCVRFRQVDNHLINALVERWRQETHTFHFPIGECTVTLQDVEVLFGLPVDGRAVTDQHTRRSVGDWQKLCDELLGFKPDTAAIDGSRLLIKVVTDHLEGRSVTVQDPDVVVQQDARCIIMLMVATLFADKSCTKVSLRYLPLLRDLRNAGRFSWGGAVLAYLYRELCTASKLDRGGIGGPVMLLQYWAWERLSQVRPRLPRMRYDQHDPLGGAVGPRARHWADSKLEQTNTPGHSTKMYRDLFDQMLPAQMTWQPYSEDILERLPRYCTTGAAIWRARAPLICFQMVEWHQPDRVLRQFGMRQAIPLDCDTEDHLHVTDLRGGNANKDWSVKRAGHIQIWDTRHDLVVGTYPSDEQLGPHDPYMIWFGRITRRLIGPVAVPHRSKGFQPVAAIRESMASGIAHVSGLSQHGLHDADLASETLDHVYRVASQLLVSVGESHRISSMSQSQYSRSRVDVSQLIHAVQTHDGSVFDARVDPDLHESLQCQPPRRPLTRRPRQRRPTMSQSHYSRPEVDG